MLNLIKMDLYRLVRLKSFKTGLIAAAIFSFVSLFAVFGLIEITDMLLKEDPTLSIIDMATVFPILSWYTGVDYGDIVLFGTNTLSLFVGCLISASFIGAEQSAGYFKNVAGQVRPRGLTVVSKYITTCLVHLSVLVIYTIISCIFGQLFFSRYIISYNIGAMIGGLLLRTLLFFAINAVIVFFCILAKNQTFAMVIGAILGIGVTGFVYFGINALLGMVKITGIDVSHFMPDGINGILNVSSLGEIYISGIIVSIIFIAGFIFGAIMLIEKRDVK